jgi:uracil-DNA glycosylase family 4
MLVGEALGDWEAIDGLPFRPQAQAGSELERAFKRGGWDRQQFSITNLVRCKPPSDRLDGAPWERGAIDACRIHLDESVERFRPKAIVSLGRLPTRELTGLWGDKQGILMIRGFVCDGTLYPGIPVIPTVHPSFIARGEGIQAEVPGEKKSKGLNPKHLRGTLIRDLQLALRVAQNGFQRPKEDYWIFPPREAAEEFERDCREHPELTIFVDIETPNSMFMESEDEAERFDIPVVQIQFSIREGHSIVMPWEEPYISIAKRILALPNAKAGWNLLDFDEPILWHNGVPMNGPKIDSMYLWHHYQPDLPQGLQFATSFACPEAGPWKHLHSSQPGVYGGKDSNYNLITHNWCLKQLDKRGMLQTYLRHVEEYYRTLKRISLRGIPVSKPKLDEFGPKVEKDLEMKEGEMQALHPDELKGVSPEKGYIRDPEDTTGMVRRIFDAEVTKKDACLECFQSGKVEVTVEKTLKSGKIQTKTKLAKCPKCGGRGYTVNGKEPQQVERWCNLLPFKTSQKQILAYLRWKMAWEEETLPKTRRIYKIPSARERDGRVRETTEEVELEKLYRKTLKAGREDLLLGQGR